MSIHISEEDLILHYYGEQTEADTSFHLSECSGCRARYAQLQSVLNVVDLPVPNPAVDWEDGLWNRIAPASVRKRFAWLSPKRWIPAVAICSMLVIAFLAGRYSPRSESEARSIAGVQQAPVRERVLVVAVGDHLEKSQLILVELVNSSTKGAVDIKDEQSFAQALLTSNRLYRQTASAAGETGLVTLLEDIERVLADIAHSPDTLSSTEIEELRQRIENQGLLFKIRVMNSTLNERISKPATAAESGSKQL